jgi:hypothetical protein
MSAVLTEPEAKGYSLEKPFRIYSRSPVVYWWPIWAAGFLCALLSYLGGGYMAWVPKGTEAQPQARLEAGPGEVQTRPALVLPPGSVAPGEEMPAPIRPQVRMAKAKYLGFAFVVLVALVLLHSSVLMRGYIAYVNLLVGVVCLLAIPLAEAYAPELHLWGWLKYLIYELPSIYISMHGYLFFALFVLAIWLWSYFWRDRLTYIEVAASQVRVVQEIGEGEAVYDATSLTFEKRRDDVFRHEILGLGFLRYLGLGFLTTGAGDLVFRTSGSQPQVIDWPNVQDVRRQMHRLTRVLAARQVV